MPATNCKSRARRKHERSVKVLIPALICDRQRLTLIRITQDGKAAHYWVALQASAWGLAFSVERAGEEVEDGAEGTYDVLLENEQDSSCSCPGHTYHGHCKHVEALRALLAAGKLPLPSVAHGE